MVPALAARRKGKIMVIRGSAEELPHIFHLDPDGNLFPCEVRRLLNLIPNSKTEKEKKEYENERAKNMAMKFPLTRSRRTKKLKVTWKLEASIQHADSSGSILHDECDKLKDERSSGDAQSQSILQNPRGIATSTTPIGRRKGKTKVTWKSGFINFDDNIHQAGGFKFRFKPT